MICVDFERSFEIRICEDGGLQGVDLKKILFFSNEQDLNHFRSFGRTNILLPKKLTYRHIP